MITGVLHKKRSRMVKKYYYQHMIDRLAEKRFCFFLVEVQRDENFKVTVQKMDRPNPAGNYMFKVNNRNSRTRCEMFKVNTLFYCFWTCFFLIVHILTCTNYEKSRFLLYFFMCECSQPAFTCSKLATEALEQGVKYVQS